MEKTIFIIMGCIMFVGGLLVVGLAVSAYQVMAPPLDMNLHLLHYVAIASLVISGGSLAVTGVCMFIILR